MSEIETGSTLGTELAEAMMQLDEERVLRISRELAISGCSYCDVLPYLNAGIKKAGELFERGDYFIADLIVSGIIYRAALNIFQYQSSDRLQNSACRVAIGVVHEDIHDVGKNIIVTVLRASGFEVIDLGVDVKPEDFVSAVRQYQPKILLLSGLLHDSQEYMLQTIDALERVGLREGLSILVGGGCITPGEPIRKADDSTLDPMETLQFCMRISAEVSHGQA
ncbi:MAG: cobalamin-dependent protein [Oscillospiraceae bacterium]|nr:cobalamin-dependent protein [Oscillospiraceae bacterium]